MRDEVLYSNKLYKMMSTYVIDGKCIKNRYGALSIGKKEIKRRMENFENIAIQNDDKIVMYCDNNLFPLVKDTIENDSFISRAHKNNKVVLIRGGSMNETQEKLAAALLSSNASMLDKIDIGEDSYENVDLIIEFYSKPCKWEYDEVCVNDQSEWCADFIDNIKCGGCQEYEIKKD